LGTQASNELEAELFYLTASFSDGLKIRISEYAVANETAKNYMCLPLEEPKYKWKNNEKESFPKEHEGKVQIDHWNGMLRYATLFMTEVSREEVETYGVNLLKEELREWLQKRADYFTRKIDALDKHTIE
jgi:hypothetical protein